MWTYSLYFNYYIYHIGTDSDQGLGWTPFNTWKPPDLATAHLLWSCWVKDGQSPTLKDQVAPQTISETDREAIDLVLDQLSAKKHQSVELSLHAATTSAEDLEEEVLDTEMHHFELLEQIATLKKFSSLSAQKSSPDVPVQQTDMESGDSEQQEPAKNNHQLPEQRTEPADDARPILVYLLCRTHLLYIMWVILWFGYPN